MRRPHHGEAGRSRSAHPHRRVAGLRRGKVLQVIKYILRKTLTWLAMIFVATNLVYFLANFFLDPYSNYIDRRPVPPVEQVTRILAPFNLSREVPLIERWWTWLTSILTQWNWGYSPAGQSVNDQIAFRVGVSAQLMLGATVITCIVGISLGVFTASRQYSIHDRIWQAVSVVAMNTHVVVASLAVVLMAIRLNNAAGRRIFFVTGASSVDVNGFFPSLIDKAQHLILPTICLVFINYASYHFLQRSLLLDNINADYVRTARAKGLTKPQAIRRHALRTSIIPVVTQIAFSIPAIFTGAVMTETIFAWEGMGRYFLTTIQRNDIHGVVAVAAFGALMTAVGAVLSDILVVLVDPRVRVS